MTTSRDTKGPILPTSVGNSCIYVIADAFCHFFSLTTINKKHFYKHTKHCLTTGCQKSVIWITLSRQLIKYTNGDLADLRTYKGEHQTLRRLAEIISGQLNTLLQAARNTRNKNGLLKLKKSRCFQFSKTQKQGARPMSDFFGRKLKKPVMFNLSSSFVALGQ